jgi:uncharacterized DUF497 family protein
MPRKPKRSSQRITVRDWDVDDGNVEELAAHGLTIETVDAIASNQPRFRRNKKRRAATHQMVGPDNGGAFFVVCLLETGPGIWRPITGWAANAQEIDWWRKSQ